MSRLPGVEAAQAGLLTRFIYWLVKRRLGRVPASVKIRAYSPKLLRVVGQMDQFDAKPNTVPPRVKRLAQLRVATLVGCPF